MSDEQELARAYRGTSYWVQTQSPFCVRVGTASAAMDSLLKDYGTDTWAFITAFNPRSRRVSAEENRTRDTALIARLDRDGFRHVACDGVDDDGNWPTEHGHVVFAIDAETARALGREFAQNAILLGRLGDGAAIVFLRLACKKNGPV